MQPYTDCHDEEHLASFYSLSPRNLLSSSRVKRHNIPARQKSLSFGSGSGILARMLLHDSSSTGLTFDKNCNSHCPPVWVWGLYHRQRHSHSYPNHQVQSLTSSTAPAATTTGNKSPAGISGQQPPGGLEPHLGDPKGTAEDQTVWVQQLL